MAQPRLLPAGEWSTDSGSCTPTMRRSWSRDRDVRGARSILWNESRERKAMRRSHLVFMMASVMAFAATAARAQAPDVPAPYKDVLTLLGKQGDFKDGVLKVNIPRNDVAVTVKGVKTPTPFGFGGWVALSKGTAMDVMMGDLVLLQDEVNPVMSALLQNGIDVTALHNHFFWDEPRMFYMHVHAHGGPMDLARKVKPALDLIGKSSSAPPPAAASAAGAPALDPAKPAQ